MTNEAGEIEKLLRKIDEDTERIKYLETCIDFERKAKQEAERRLQVLEGLRAKSSYQQSRILKERDVVVREMSVELDNISTRLKNSVNENVDWKRRYQKLERIYEELEGDFFKLKGRHEKLQRELSEKKIELRHTREVTDLYQNLKKDVQLRERWTKQEKNLIHMKAREISAHYRKLREDIEFSQGKLRKMIVRNSRVMLDAPGPQRPASAERGLLEQKVLALTKDNLYLKKELLHVLSEIIKRNSKEIGAAGAEKDELSAEASREDLFLKGSILSFSNNNIHETSFEPPGSKKKLPSPGPTKISERQEELQRSAVINVKKFRKIQAMYHQNAPLQPLSLHVSKARGKASADWLTPESFAAQDQSERPEETPKRLFSESVPLNPCAEPLGRAALGLSPEKQGEMAHLQKSIQAQNRLISEQISRFFEQQHFYKSLEQPRALQTAVARNYSFAQLTRSPQPKMLSFREIEKKRQSSRKVQLALQRDSMKKLHGRGSGRAKLPSREKPAKNLFQSGSSHPKLYSRRNLKISKRSETGLRKPSAENLSESPRKVAASDFGTLGKEGNIIWVKDDSRKASKGKFHYVDQVRKRQLSNEFFQNVVLEAPRKPGAKGQASARANSKSKSKQNPAAGQKAKVLKKSESAQVKVPSGVPGLGEIPSVKRSIKHKRGRSKSQRKHFVVSEILQDRELKSVVHSVNQHLPHKATSRSRSALPGKRASEQMQHLRYTRSKYKILRNLDKERKRSGIRSMRSEAMEQNLRDESFLVLKEKQLKLRVIRRNFMKKWKEKRIAERNQSLQPKSPAPKRRSKSIKTQLPAKVNQWAPFKTQAKGSGEISQGSSLGSLRKSPVGIFSKERGAKETASLYKNRKKAKGKSLKAKLKEAKKLGKKPRKKKPQGKAKPKRNASKYPRKKSRNQQRTYTNKFESTKKAFEFAKRKRGRMDAGRPNW